MTSQSWSLRLAKYRQQDNLRGLREITVTASSFAALWAATWLLALFSYWLALLVAVPAAGFLVRLFLIQHDCGHGTLFTKRAVNDWVGRFLGVLTLTPYDYWRNSHAHHHASSGNLDRRGIGDIKLLTVREYTALGSWGRFGYRLYRHPLVMFGLGPTYLFVFQHRFPIGVLRGDKAAWISTLATNLGIVTAMGLMAAALGWGPFLKVHAPITIMAASMGVWLFYVQHQFEETFWASPPDWSPHLAALQGSSYYDLPAPLRWLTANIGFHHLHHLSSKIPFYRLPTVLKEWPELEQAHRLTVRESAECVKLTLWDEQSRQLVSFRQARAGLLGRSANASECGMAIEFSNLSRRYDATRHCVRFSGYDGAMEKFFFVQEEAIWRLDAIARKDGAALLETFDRHRERICKVASQVYGKRREGSYTLTAADFF